MGNSRETRNTIGPASKPYWNFSFDEISTYDYPALIDGILKLTNESKLFFIGMSQAASCLLSLLSSIPEYNEKIIQAHTLVPFVSIQTFSHQRTLLKIGLKVNNLCFELEIQIHFHILISF